MGQNQGVEMITEKEIKRRMKEILERLRVAIINEEHEVIIIHQSWRNALKWVLEEK